MNSDFLPDLQKTSDFDHTFSPDLFRCIYRLRLFFFSCKSQGYTNVSSTLGWYKKYLEGELGSSDCRTWLWARTSHQMETDKVVIFFLFNKKKERANIYIWYIFFFFCQSEYSAFDFLFSIDFCQNVIVFKWLADFLLFLPVCRRFEWLTASDFYWFLPECCIF